MLFSQTLIFTVSIFSGIGALGAPLAPPVINSGLSFKSSRLSTFSLVSLIDRAQSRMDQALNRASGSYALDLTALNDIVSTTNDVSNTLATDLQSIDPSLDTLMVDATGNKLTNDQLASKIASLLKAFETACLTARSTGSGEIASIVELITLNIDDMNDGLRQAVPYVNGIITLADSFKQTDATLSQLVDDILKRP